MYGIFKKKKIFYMSRISDNMKLPFQVLKSEKRKYDQKDF